MALEFFNKTTNIEVVDTLSDINLKYTFVVSENGIEGRVSGTATLNNKVVAIHQTKNGNDFYGNIQSSSEDDLTGLVEKMKEDLAEIINNYENYIPT